MHQTPQEEHALRQAEGGSQAMEWQATSPWWLPDGHSQTIWPALLGVSHWQPICYQRTAWTTPDNDRVWVDTHPHPTEKPAETPTVVVLFHGLEGSAQSPYALALAEVTRHLGWTLVVPHFRGCGGDINPGPRAYHSGDATEIDWMLARVASDYPAHRRVAIGVSLGGNALMRWAAQIPTQSGPWVQAVAAVSAPLDLAAAGQAIDHGVNRWLYARMFLATMKRKAQQKWKQYPGLFDLERVMRARTLAAFDDGFTAPLHGFDGVADYWERAAALPLLRQMALPALLVNALNDPFVPRASLPAATQVSASTTRWQPAHGGHVGFCVSDARQRWPGHVQALPQALCAWLSRAAP